MIGYCARILPSVIHFSLQDLKSYDIVNERGLHIVPISQKHIVLIPGSVKWFRPIDTTIKYNRQANCFLNVFDLSGKWWCNFAFWKKISMIETATYQRVKDSEPTQEYTSNVNWSYAKWWKKDRHLGQLRERLMNQILRCSQFCRRTLRHHFYPLCWTPR